MFNYSKEIEGEYCGYTYKDILPNGQTIEFIFYDWHEDDVFTVSMEIYSKRKKRSRDFLESTGKCGISGLILAKLVLECFIEYLKEITPIGKSKQIMVHASDNKRKRIYKRHLSKLGFVYTRTKFKDMAMCIDINGKKEDD